MTTPHAVPPNEGAPLSRHLTEPTDNLMNEDPMTTEPPAQNAAQSAVHRLGGARRRLWRSDTPGQSLLSVILNIITGLLLFVLLGTVIFLWMLVNQQQIQLTTLDAAFRSGQLQSLPDRLQRLEEAQSQSVLKTQAEQWQQALAQQGEQLKTVAEQNTRLQATLTSTVQAQEATDLRTEALQRTLAAQQLRLDALAEWKVQMTKNAVSQRSTAPGGRTPAVKKPLKPKIKPLTPPFTLTGLDRRGGQVYAVVLPTGQNDWSQLRMLSPGDAVSGWQLQDISGNQAVFQVNGQTQRLTLQ